MKINDVSLGNMFLELLDDQRAGFLDPEEVMTKENPNYDAATQLEWDEEQMNALVAETAWVGVGFAGDMGLFPFTDVWYLMLTYTMAVAIRSATMGRLMAEGSFNTKSVEVRQSLFDFAEEVWESVNMADSLTITELEEEE